LFFVVIGLLLFSC